MWSVTVLALAALASGSTSQSADWWTNGILYQIYPRSFKDSNSDGIGDLPGITSKLEHIKDAGADAFWISPIYASPQVDFGYDIANFTDITEEYGTLDDFDDLVAEAKRLGLKVLLDFVPNHSSNEHLWFKKSIERIPPYDEYYIWRDAKQGPNGERLPPNNWLSSFGGSAWEWVEERGQYYYHAFAAGQPDLNYRNPKLRREMERVLTFWMHRGVDGFRVDVPYHMFERADLLDEPRSSLNVPEDDYDYLDHIYTKHLAECYFVIESWQILLDNYALERKAQRKLMILEVYGTVEQAMGYYDVGSNPFNMMFVGDLNRRSKAIDFKRAIDNWLTEIPEGSVPNWVVGNHDQSRVSSRFGSNGNRADQITMLSIILPGLTVVYNGDEIGMVDRPFTWEETVDPAGCNAGPDRYYLKSRDPQRTPYQWDNTISAGFSNNFVTWLPVNENYKTLNLEAQKQAEVSNYKVFQALTRLKKSPILQKGTVEVLLATEDVLGVVRRLKGQDPVALLINFSDMPVEIDARSWLGIPEEVKVYTASVKSGLTAGQKLDTSKLRLRGAASVILH